MLDKAQGLLYMGEVEREVSFLTRRGIPRNMPHISRTKIARDKEGEMTRGEKK